MGKRLQIVLLYNYDENWIGGTYYIQNLIHSLVTIEDCNKPVLHIKSYNKNALNELQKLTTYPYLKEYIPYNHLNIIKRASNKLSKLVLKKETFPLYKKFDAFFPSFSEEIDLSNKIFWIPDFQEKHLPHFFSDKEIKNRNKVYVNIQNNAFSVVFSSKDAQKDFNQFYPNAKPKQFVLNFATFHQNKNLPSKEGILQKFQIFSEYFLCSNQFWVHKNHQIILNAISILKKEGIEVLVVFTGKEYDYRNPEYFDNIKKIVTELSIDENVKFLGFIDREEQIVLLQNCKSVIQPSLFEGWSTVNEDAKAENIYILAADLEVNKEQLINYPNYRLFNPNDAKDLANQIKMDNFVTSKIDYINNLKNFGDNFLEIVKKTNTNQ